MILLLSSYASWNGCCTYTFENSQISYTDIENLEKEYFLVKPSIAILQNENERFYAEILAGHDTGKTIVFPPNTYFDTFHDSDSILLMHYDYTVNTFFDQYEKEMFLTIEYENDEWIVKDITDGQTYTADAKNGIYTFNDYWMPDVDFELKLESENRLAALNFQCLEWLVYQYELQYPNRPSMCDLYETEN